MISNIVHRNAMHHNPIPVKTEKGRNRKSIRFRRLKFPSIFLIIIVLVSPIARADPYEVLVIDIAAAEDLSKIEEYKKDTEKFNSLHNKGYSDARPYFSVLHMASGQVFFVFGFKGKVQGIHRNNYPGTIENLRRMKHKRAPEYPHM